jgi:gluconate 2-dehydrogenase alpha chain
VAIDDWCGDNFDHTGLGFIGGALMTDGSGSAQTLMSLVSLTPPGVPTWGSTWKAWMHDNVNSIGMISYTVGALTYDRNYLQLDPVIRDPQGVPVIRITFDWNENEKRCAAYSETKAQMWLREAGATTTWSTFAGPGHLSLHAYGGTRIGDDPDQSVVDRWCFSHEVPNLGILGASCMPTSGSHNPALTVQALAWRSAAHLISEWGSIAG